jgi:hypothetical protein
LFVTLSICTAGQEPGLQLISRFQCPGDVAGLDRDYPVSITPEALAADADYWRDNFHDIDPANPTADSVASLLLGLCVNMQTSAIFTMQLSRYRINDNRETMRQTTVRDFGDSLARAYAISQFFRRHVPIEDVRSFAYNLDGLPDDPVPLIDLVRTTVNNTAGSFALHMTPAFVGRFLPRIIHEDDTRIDEDWYADETNGLYIRVDRPGAVSSEMLYELGDGNPDIGLNYLARQQAITIRPYLGLRHYVDAGQAYLLD